MNARFYIGETHVADFITHVTFHRPKYDLYKNCIEIQNNKLMTLYFWGLIFRGFFRQKNNKLLLGEGEICDDRQTIDRQMTERRHCRGSQFLV